MPSARRIVYTLLMSVWSINLRILNPDHPSKGIKKSVNAPPEYKRFGNHPINIKHNVDDYGTESTKTPAIPQPYF